MKLDPVKNLLKKISRLCTFKLLIRNLTDESGKVTAWKKAIPAAAAA